MSKIEYKAPWIENAWLDFLDKVSLGDPTKIEPFTAYQMKQSFYTAFAHAHGLTVEIMTNHKDQIEVIKKEILEELAWFSKQSRELAASIGTKTVSALSGEIKEGEALKEVPRGLRSVPEASPP